MVHFGRGSSWTGGLKIDDSGEEGNPIVFRPYGVGNRPIFRNPGNPHNWTTAVEIEADWVLLEGFLVQDAHRFGVRISRDSDHNVVRDIEVTRVGIGIGIQGEHNLVARNYVHDLHLVVNTPGGIDDFGAVGIWLFNSNNEVCYNRMMNCIASSYDFGSDGGALEWHGYVDNCYVHHNIGIACRGFLEVGGGAARNNTVAYNVSIDNGSLVTILLGGPHGGDVENFWLENNTVVDRNDDDGGRFIGFSKGEPSLDTLIMRNNVFHVNKRIAYKSAFSHNHNLYYRGDGNTDLGLSLNDTEQFADPLFVNLDGEDLRLQPGSPAIDGGIDLGYSLDFDDRPVPVGQAPDMGAFEFQAASPTPILTVTPTSTPDPNEMILDDGDPGFSTSFSQDAWQEYVEINGQHYGDSHFFNRQIGAGQDMATWVFTVPLGGRYKVYSWWWEGSWRPTDVPHTVHHLHGSSTIRVDQRANGGQWNLLGAFDFQTEGSLVVSDAVSSGRDVVADAVRLVYLGPLPSSTPSPTRTTLPPTATPNATRHPGFPTWFMYLPSAVHNAASLSGSPGEHPLSNLWLRLWHLLTRAACLFIGLLSAEDHNLPYRRSGQAARPRGQEASL
jgi:hypothetical protein